MVTLHVCDHYESIVQGIVSKLRLITYTIEIYLVSLLPPSVPKSPRNILILPPVHKNYQKHLRHVKMHIMREKDKEIRLVTRPVPKPPAVCIACHANRELKVTYRPIPAGIGNVYIFRRLTHHNPTNVKNL